MSNGAGDVIDEFYESKKKEAEETNPPAKKIVKLVFAKVGDLCSVEVDGNKLVGEVKAYYLERAGDIEKMEIELEVIDEQSN